MAMNQCGKQHTRCCQRNHRAKLGCGSRQRFVITRCRKEDEHRKSSSGRHETGSREESSFLRFVDKHMAYLMPQEAGDWKDWFWMLFSTLILVYFSACLFMLYDYIYRAAGLVTFSEFMSQ